MATDARLVWVVEPLQMNTSVGLATADGESLFDVVELAPHVRELRLGGHGPVEHVHLPPEYPGELVVHREGDGRVALEISKPKCIDTSALKELE